LIKKAGKWEHIFNLWLKKAEEVIFLSIKDWERTFYAIPYLIAIIDDKYRFVRVNKAMATRLGMIPEECVGLTCYNVVHEKDEPPSFCLHRRLLTDNLEHVKKVHEDGLGGYFIVSVSPLYDYEGKFTGCIHVARDINECTQAEKALQESEERFRSAFDESAVGMALVAPDGRFLGVNDALCRLLGFKAYELKGRSFLEFTHKGDIDASFVAHKAVVDKENPSLWIEKRYINKNGQIIWCELSSSPVLDSKGCTIYTVAHVQDVTEHKKAEETVRLSNIYNRSLI
jgi:PAS domain S-box-containing protein